MKWPAFLTLLAAVTGFAAGSAHAQTDLGFFATDVTLWNLPPDEMSARLGPLGYTPVPANGSATLGEPRDLMKRRAELAPGLPVWQVTLFPGTKLRRAILSLLPPPQLAATPTKSAFRATAKSAADWLTKTFSSQGKPWQIDYANPGRKVECTRWISPSLQAILSVSYSDSARAFAPERLEVTILPSAAFEPPPSRSFPVLKSPTGVAFTSVAPAPAWDLQHPEFAVLEQALATIGKATDRNAIIECGHLGSSWPGTFCPALLRIARASGAKPMVLVPEIHAPTETAKLLDAVRSAAKRTGFPAPDAIQNLIDLHPETLRAARGAPAATAQFTNALRKALEANQPVLWVGWHGLFKESTETPAKPITALRLISGLSPKDNTVTFAGPDGHAASTLPIADTLAASLFVLSLAR